MIPHILACLLALPLLGAAARPKNAILLSEVQSLTLRGNGAMTSHRRVPALPQLKCISRKEICNLYDIDVMRCTNQGSSYGDEDIQWSCKATLPEELKLGSTDVICEGYSSPDDPYVLKGSCGVEYRLALTSKGQHRYPNLSNGGWFNDGNGSTDWSAWLFTIIFVAILVWIIYSACFAAQDRTQRPARRRPGFGGGGGGWNPGWGPDNNDPPPPYPGTKPSGQQQGWQPGFWSGLAGGAAAGYFAGNRGQNHQDTGYGSIGRGNNRWGGGSNNGRSSSNSSGGSAPHESTGFGSTSRR